MQKLEVTFDEVTGQLQLTFPKSLVTALGLVEYARLMIEAQVRERHSAPHIVPVHFAPNGGGP